VTVSHQNLTAEDRLDRMYRLLAMVFLGIGTMYVVGALQFVLPQGGWFTQVARWIRVAVLVVVPVLCGLAVWRGLSFKRACAGASLMAKEGFVFGAIQKSAVRAGFLVWIALVLMRELSDDSTLPAKFYLNTAMAVLTLTFSISFLRSSSVEAEHE
jgi:hypothetical protein